MIHTKVIDQTGISTVEASREGISDSGYVSAAVADTGVVVTAITQNAGLIIVKDDTTTDSAMFAIVDTAGTVATEQIAVNAAFTITKDNAATINVYIETGVLKVQNNSGGAIDINIKAFI